MANRVAICSIDPLGFKNIHRSYSWDLDLPPCPPDQPYVIRWYEDQTDYKIVLVDYWIEHAEKVPIPVDARAIVNDILRTEGMERRGCFIPAAETPAEPELVNAHLRRMQYMEECIRRGDQIFGQDPKNIGEIPGEFKRYAVELKADRPWAYSAPKQRKVPCPACGEEIIYGVAICSKCHAILDREKAVMFGLVPPEPVKPSKAV